MKPNNIKQMRILKTILAIAYIIGVTSCNELDLASLDKANSESWYAKQDHYRYSLNDLYRNTFFKKPSDTWSDDYTIRTNGNTVKNGTVDSEWGDAATYWAHLYKGVSRANTVIAELEAKGEVLGEDVRNQFMGEAEFMKASFYGQLIYFFGDVPFFDKNISIDESYTVARTDLNTVKGKVYELFDRAAAKLPASYEGAIYATKGAALAYKARTALYLGDYEVAKTAAKACIDLGVYSLHNDFADLFFSKTKVSSEFIFTFPRSNDLDIRVGINTYIPRNHPSGYAQTHPTWNLLASAYCTDGLPVDESPLFDPHNPFMNRDPRLLATIIPFGKLKADDDRTPESGTNFYGIEFNTHPLARQVMNYNENKMIVNKDTRSIGAYASFNGLVRSKGCDEEWLDDRKTETADIACRYAEVLLTYAEAKIELNEIDDSVLEVLNSLRERGYAGSGVNYPVIATKDQGKLRLIVRNERRIELAFEGMRYMDLIRWQLAEKALVGNNYGLAKINQQPDLSKPVTGDMITNVIEPGHWFWGITPEIDNDGLPNFQALDDAGMCSILSVMEFDKTRQYLFPIPNSNRKLNPELTQNPGY
ncbi:RagB/SusD family nutrient uptake outer membrane protein [Prolixibacteraceae bacterium JC049]|nr:RagB/SusD family nutrient uptake outer membrane protein [Prolixibacteraceae bacterium JC049]